MSEIHLEGANLNYAHLEGTFLISAHINGALSVNNILPDKATLLNFANLQSSQLINADLSNAHMNGVHLEGACLVQANLTNARINNAYLEGADLRNASLEGTKLTNTHIESANFRVIYVNERTKILNCYIDKKTNFTAVALDSVIINPSLLSGLKTNIRRMAWQNYCNQQENMLIKDYFFNILTTLAALFEKPWSLIVNICHIFASYFGFIGDLLQLLKSINIRFFWWISDYGSNTDRIFKVFLTAIFSFSLCYLLISSYGPRVLPKLIKTDVWWLDLLSTLCFAFSTMVTLGFGGINVEIQKCIPFWSAFALIIVTLNLVTGYLILAVLVTRLGILFQSLAPEQKVSKSIKEYPTPPNIFEQNKKNHNH